MGAMLFIICVTFHAEVRGCSLVVGVERVELRVVLCIVICIVLLIVHCNVYVLCTLYCAVYCLCFERLTERCFRSCAERESCLLCGQRERERVI